MKKVSFVFLMLIVVATAAVGADDYLYPMVIGDKSVRAGAMNWRLSPAIENLSFDIVISYGDELDLTTAQKKELRDLRASYRVDIKKQKEKLVKLESELDKLYERSSINYKEILAKVMDIEAIQYKIRNLYFETLEKTDSVLTDRQKAIFRTLQK